MQEPSADARATKLIKIAYGQAKAKDMVGSEETFELAAKACTEISDPASQARASALLAEAYALLGSKSESKQAVRRALASAEKIEDVESQARILARVAEVQGAGQDVAGGKQTLASAEEKAGQLEDLQGKTLVLDAVAREAHAAAGLAQATASRVLPVPACP